MSTKHLGTLIVVLCVACAAVNYRVNEVRDAIVDKIAALKVEIASMQTLKETVTTASGRKIEVSTTRMEGESMAAFGGRHNEAVTWAQGQS